MPEFTVLAFDIETTKEPLKFPDADYDKIMLISYVIDEQAFLIVNWEICSKDIREFTFSPTQDQVYDVVIFNELNELKCLEKFFSHIWASKPLILTTFNGDYFDMPFIKKRSQILGIDMEKQLGI